MKKTFATLAGIAALAGCIGSSEPRYVGPPKRDVGSVTSGTAHVHSGTAYVESQTHATYQRPVFDQTQDPYLDLWNAEKPFLLPMPPKEQPEPRQEAPKQEYSQPQGDLY